MLNLVDYIKNNGVIQRHSVTLSSGKQSDIYFNCNKITLDSQGLHLAATQLLAAMWEITPFDAVGGMTMGADPIVGGILAHVGFANEDYPRLKGFLVRKEPKQHGNKNLIEGPVEPGMKVAVVEDVTTSGGSAAKAIKAAQDFGMEVVVVGAIINRKEGADALFENLKIPFVWLCDNPTEYGDC